MPKPLPALSSAAGAAKRRMAAAPSSATVVTPAEITAPASAESSAATGGPASVIPAPTVGGGSGGGGESAVGGGPSAPVAARVRAGGTSLPVLAASPATLDAATSAATPPGVAARAVAAGPAPVPVVIPAADAGDEPLVRVMALHALLYCERLFYLEEVEEIRVADDRVYAGRELHGSLAAAAAAANEDRDPADLEHTSVELTSPTLGLFGKVDCVKRRDGVVLPYEHKRGRCRRGDDGVAGAWPSDRVQVSAYGLMLEEATGRAVPEGRVRYHADGVTVRVPLDDAARAEVRAAVGRARALRRSLDRPPVTENERLCRRCSLAPVCLPEEVRQEQDPDREAVRLFPPNDQRTTLHVVSDGGASVGRSGERFVVRPRDGDETKHASHEVAAIVLHGHNQITTQAIGLCADRDVAVHWVSYGGRHVASLVASAGQVQRRVRQYKALSDDAVRLRLAKQLVRAKVEGQHRYLLRGTRGADAAHDRNAIRGDLSAIADALASAGRAKDVDALRGHEGEAAYRYFAGLRALVADSVPPELRYAGRTRRPTVDRFSAILNFGYALLQTAVMRSILAAGLEPALGFYHTPRSAAHPLVLDLMELFRCPLWDLVVVGSLNRGQWHPHGDFVVTKTKTWLSDAGRRKAIGLFEGRLAEEWRHPVVDYSLSYARTIELEARLLEKEWTGEPGLFARMRLR